MKHERKMTKMLAEVAAAAFTVVDEFYVFFGVWGDLRGVLGTAVLAGVLIDFTGLLLYLRGVLAGDGERDFLGESLFLGDLDLFPCSMVCY